MNHKSSILFDQYSRYAATAAQVRGVAQPGDTILDVGSGVYRLLGRFLSDYKITYLDPLLKADAADPCALHGRLADLPVDNSFDVVVCVDTLEHVPAAEREAFVNRAMSVARKAVILTGPYCGDTDAAAEHVDAVVNNMYRAKTGSDFHWLREHAQYGLPDLRTWQEHFSNAGWHLAHIGNGHAPWMEQLLPLIIGLIDQPNHRAVLENISEQFNALLFPFDHLPPSYRHVLVATAPAQSPPDAVEASQSMCDGSQARNAMARAWSEFWPHAVALISQHADKLLADKSSGDMALRQTVDRLKEQVQQGNAHHKLMSESLKRNVQELHAVQSQAATWHQQLKNSTANLKQMRLQLNNTTLLLKQSRGQLQTLLDERRKLRWAIALMHPIRAIRKVIEVCGRHVYHALPESWRHPAAKIFFTVFKPLMRHTDAAHAYHQIRQWKQNAPQIVTVNDQAQPQAKAPDFRSGAREKQDVLAWGVIDWHFRKQRPQHLAIGLADLGHRIFYFTPRFTITPHATQGGYSHQLVYESHNANQIGERGCVYQVALHVPERVRIYEGAPTGQALKSLRNSIKSLIEAIGVRPVASIVQHPTWSAFLDLVPASSILYDCMDHHEGFENTGQAVCDYERLLMETADAVLVSSEKLYELAKERGSRQAIMVRNAADYHHFASKPSKVFKDKRGRRVVGYFGAIAEWFDVELIRKLATSSPDVIVLLVGADSAHVRDQLAGISNVEMTGEVSFDDLPYYLHGFDVCIIPFLINDLTRATNPVKVYEYLAAGKPVVATALPELQLADFRGLATTAHDHEGFIAAVQHALSETHDEAHISRRQEFACSQTWQKRIEALEPHLNTISRGRVCIVMLTWNNVELTRQAVRSVLADDSYPDFELILIDNASNDGTGELVDEFAKQDSRVRSVRNERNRGFAAGNNQGLQMALAGKAAYIVFLNNDTVVTRGWLRTLTGYVQRDRAIGIIGPITNNIGNEARVPMKYQSLDEMPQEASAIMAKNAGRVFDIHAVAFFCVMIPRDIAEQLGTLDEGYGLGFFEDDDYCQRIRAIGRRVVCAEDVYIHHELSASFKKMDQGERRELFDRNRAYYESKWGTWQPHTYRVNGNGTATNGYATHAEVNSTIATPSVSCGSATSSAPGVFVIGSPRSGTSALAWALANHPDMATGPEVDFFYYLCKQNSPQEAYEQAAARPDGWLATNGVKLDEFLRWSNIGFDMMLKEHYGGKIWVDSTPANSVVCEQLRTAYPQAKFIHIIRDGRAVVASMQNSGFGVLVAEDFEMACRTWAMYVEQAHRFALAHPDCCLEVRQEELAGDPKMVMQQVLQFLGVPHSPQPAEYLRKNRINSSYAKRELVTVSSGATIRKPSAMIQAAPAKPWTAWNAKQRAMFLKITGGVMQAMGYPSELD